MATALPNLSNNIIEPKKLNVIDIHSAKAHMALKESMPGKLNHCVIPPAAFAFYYKAQEEAKEGTDVTLELKKGIATIAFTDESGQKRLEQFK